MRSVACTSARCSAVRRPSRRHASSASEPTRPPAPAHQPVAPGGRQLGPDRRVGGPARPGDHRQPLRRSVARCFPSGSMAVTGASSASDCERCHPLAYTATGARTSAPPVGPRPGALRRSRRPPRRPRIPRRPQPRRGRPAPRRRRPRRHRPFRPAGPRSAPAHGRLWRTCVLSTGVRVLGFATWARSRWAWRPGYSRSPAAFCRLRPSRGQPALVTHGRPPGRARWASRPAAAAAIRPVQPS